MRLSRFWTRKCRGCADPSPHDAHLTWFGRWVFRARQPLDHARAALTTHPVDECHICHRPLNQPGELYCSAGHPLTTHPADD